MTTGYCWRTKYSALKRPKLIDAVEKPRTNSLGLSRYRRVRQQYPTVFGTIRRNGKKVAFLTVFECQKPCHNQSLIRERTMAGLAAARARGRLGGRPKSLDENQVKVAIALAEAGELTINEICEQVGCSRSTYYRQVASQLKAEKS